MALPTSSYNKVGSLNMQNICKEKELTYAQGQYYSLKTMRIKIF